MSWLPKKKVVVPIDFSEPSIEAVETALSLVVSPADLYVLHVLPLLTELEAGVLFNPVEDESRIQNAARAIRGRLSAAKYAGFQPQVSIGDPGYEIADFSQRIGAELVVLPSHGRTGLKRLLIGSVAERVVRMAHCPVLVLKQPMEK